MVRITKIAFRNYWRISGPIRKAKAPQKGTTPARGEEAEVVVYQPRGVGLMHTRP